MNPLRGLNSTASRVEVAADEVAIAARQATVTLCIVGFVAAAALLIAVLALNARTEPLK